MQTLTVHDERLGKITFQGAAENSLVYNKEIIKEILEKGIDYLVSEEIVTTEDQAQLHQFLNQMQIGINKNLLARSFISYQVEQTSQKVVGISYSLFAHTSTVPVVEMIQTILDDLCQMIVLVKHPQDELHGVNWLKYAEFLLPSYYIENQYPELM